MDDFLQNAKALQDAEEAIRKLAASTSLSERLQIAFQPNALSTALEAFQSQITAHHCEQQRLISSLTQPYFEVSEIMAQMADSFRQITDPVSQFTAHMNKEWQATFAAFNEISVRPFDSIGAHVARLADFSAFAENVLKPIDMSAFARNLGLPEAIRQNILTSHEQLSIKFRAFYDNLAIDPIRITELPPLLTELPTIEILNQSRLVAQTSMTTADPVQERSELLDEMTAEAWDDLTRLIAMFDPSFTTMLTGARAALEKRLPDYVRHVATSYRELFGHILRRLAPDDEVRAWTSDPGHYDDKGKPTRRARLLYLTRNISVSFGGFMSVDVAATLAFFDSFNSGTHAVTPKFTHADMCEMQTRMEGLIRLVLTVQVYSR